MFDKNIPQDTKHICFPYVLYNLPYWQGSLPQANKYSQPTTYEQANFNTDNFFPAFSVTSIIKDIFKTFNYNVEGNIFNDPRFNMLYQTYMGEPDKYVEKKEAPYYCRLEVNYQTVLGSNIDSTLQMTQAVGDIQGAATDLCLSDNSTFYKEDDYDMITDNNYIRIKKSGWYRIASMGEFNYPSKEKNKRWRQTNKMDVASTKSALDNTNLNNSPIEFQINRSTSPVFNNPTYLSIYGFEPTQPNVINSNTWTSGIIFPISLGVGLKYDETATYFPKNGQALIINDSTSPATDSFIAGARWGIWGLSQTAASHKDNVGGTIYNNPNPSKVNDATQTGSERYMLRAPFETYSTYGKTQSNVMLRGSGSNVRAFQSCIGYNKLNITENGSSFTKTWSDSQYNEKTYRGLNISSAYSESDNSGKWDIDTVIWLNKGEYINMSAILPYHRRGKKCGSLDPTCSYYDRSDCATNTKILATIILAYINNNEAWNYERDGVPYWSELLQPKMTNVNLLLPSNIKVNDYINNFCQTFNLKLSRLNSNTYSIDVSNDQTQIGEIIDIEPYTNIKRNKYSRLDLPSEYQFKFKIDTEEEGYRQEGNNNLMPKNYTGETTYINNSSTNGSIVKKESIFSYCWYKDIRWNNSTTGTLIPTPIISDASIWAKTYIEAQEDGLFTNKTFRLFYPDISNQYLCQIIPNEDFYFAPVYIVPCTNNISPDGSLVLTFDKDEPKSITNQLFNVKLSSGHQVETNLYLPNQLFNKINSSSRIKMNNDLYQIQTIEGFDPLEENETTLMLIKE